jgi:N-acetylmuramic acid 6-phosphate (MurNAc-6-P) etherase
LKTSEAELSMKESLGKTFLEVASKVLPGISRLKAGTATRPGSNQYKVCATVHFKTRE